MKKVHESYVDCVVVVVRVLVGDGAWRGLHFGVPSSGTMADKEAAAVASDEEPLDVDDEHVAPVGVKTLSGIASDATIQQKEKEEKDVLGDEVIVSCYMEGKGPGNARYRFKVCERSAGRDGSGAREAHLWLFFVDECTSHVPYTIHCVRCVSFSYMRAVGEHRSPCGIREDGGAGEA